MEEVMRVIRVSRPNVSSKSYVLSVLEVTKILDELDEMFTCDDPGEKIEIELLEISQAAFDNIGRFQGW